MSEAVQEQDGNIIQRGLDTVQSWWGGGGDPTDPAATTIGELEIPEATGDPLTLWQSTQMKLAGFAQADIEIVNELKTRYPDLDLEGTVGILAGDEELREGMMGVLQSSEEAPHIIAQQLQQDEGLTAQLEHMARTDPQGLQEILPQITDNPQEFSALIAENGPPVEEAVAANEAATEEAEFNLLGVLSGQESLRDAMGPGMYDTLANLPFIGPILQAIGGYFESGGFAGMIDNVQDGPFGQLADAMGVDFDNVTNVTEPRPEGPNRAPENEQNVDPNRDAAPGMNPHTM